MTEGTIIASLALVISIAVAMWEFVKYLLEGGRARVRMNPGILGMYSLGSSTSSWSDLAVQAKKRGGWYAEVAVVEVENPGRTALDHLGRFPGLWTY